MLDTLVTIFICWAILILALICLLPLSAPKAGRSLLPRDPPPPRIVWWDEKWPSSSFRNPLLRRGPGGSRN